jgi:S-adenosylmethionine hydrolase
MGKMRNTNKALTIFTCLLVFLCTLMVFGSTGCSSTNEVNGPIVLLTDFGSADYRVSQVKGFIYSNYPEALLVDASHDVPAFDIPTGAFMLEMAAKEFPQNTVFIAIINPYSQPEARYIVLTTDNRQVFVLPDNGLMTYVARDFGIESIYQITNDTLFDDPIEQLSAERIQGKTGALIASGYNAQDVGEPMENPVTLDITSPSSAGNELYGAVVYVDNYGNCVTNISWEMAAEFELQAGETLSFYVGETNLSIKYGMIYSDVPQGETVMFINDNLGLLQVSINLGNFADTYGVAAGTNIRISR